MVLVQEDIVSLHEIVDYLNVCKIVLLYYYLWDCEY